MLVLESHTLLVKLFIVNWTCVDVLIKILLWIQLLWTAFRISIAQSLHGHTVSENQIQTLWRTFFDKEQGWQVSASTGLNLGLNRFKPSWQKQVSTKVSATFGRNCFLTEFLSHFLREIVAIHTHLLVTLTVNIFSFSWWFFHRINWNIMFYYEY